MRVWVHLLSTSSRFTPLFLLIAHQVERIVTSNFLQFSELSGFNHFIYSLTVAVFDAMEIKIALSFEHSVRYYAEIHSIDLHLERVKRPFGFVC